MIHAIKKQLLRFLSASDYGSCDVTSTL